MATLSANSRRNSSSSTMSTTSTSTTTSRQSMGNGSVVTESIKPPLQSLHEEECTSVPIPLPAPPPSTEIPMLDQTDHYSIALSKEKSDRQIKEKTCTERSDSGFSDCSISSNGNISNNFVHTPSYVTATHPLFDKVNSILEEKSNNDHANANLRDFGGKISVNTLKMKLEKIAETQQGNKPFAINKKSVKKLSTPFVVESTISAHEMKKEFKVETKQMRTSHSFDFEDAEYLHEIDGQPMSLPAKLPQKALMRSASLHQKRIEKEPIMKSDFTNTVKMRKKSLESNALRDKQLHSQRILLESSGKVTKLLRRFDSQNETVNYDNEPIIQSPGIDDNSNEIQNDDIDKSESAKNVEEVVEILSTPMAAAQSSPPSPRKSPAKIGKTIVSSDSMKRTFASKHEYTNTKTCVTSMEVKVFSHSQSPTKIANNPMNRATSKAILSQIKQPNALKKSQKSSIIADANTVTVQRATRSANKTSTFSSFNRTSPVRLSGRVKEVTDRLSAPKSITKLPSPVRDRTIKVKTPNHQNHNTSAMANALVHDHHQMALESMSGAIKQKILTVAEAVIETEHHIEHSINGKIDGTFTLKSKMNENFRKASAFWKTT